MVATGHGDPLQHSCLENPHGQRSLAGYGPWGWLQRIGHHWATKHSTAAAVLSIFAVPGAVLSPASCHRSLPKAQWRWRNRLSKVKSLAQHHWADKGLSQGLNPSLSDGLCACVLAQLVWLCDPMDCSPSGSSAHGIFQARILEWVAISSSSISSWPRDWTCVCCVSCIDWRILYHYVTWGFPGGSDGKESTRIVEDMGLIPGVGRSPGGGHGNPLLYSCLENPHRQWSLVGYDPWGRRVGPAERLSTHKHTGHLGSPSDAECMLLSTALLPRLGP